MTTVYEDRKLIELANQYQDIDEFLSPSKLLNNTEKYMLPRLGETQQTYRYRLRNGAYTPTFSTIVDYMLMRLFSLPIEMKGPDSKFFYMSTSTEKGGDNGGKIDLSEIYSDFAKSIIKYGKVVAIIEPESKIFAESINAQGFANPYYMTKDSLTDYKIAQVLHPGMLVNFGYNSETEKPWYLVKVENRVCESPFEGVEKKTIHYYFTENKIVGISEGKEFLAANTTFNRLFTSSNVDDNSWLCEKLLSLAKMGFTTTNALLEAASNMYIQRTLELGGEDPFVENPMSTNQHIIKGDFSFVESKGTVIASLLALDNHIKKSMWDIVGVDISKQTNQVQSGLSLKLQLSKTEQILAALAQVTTTTLNKLLEKTGFDLSLYVNSEQLEDMTESTNQEDDKNEYN